jgi:hypothetical protein
MITSYVSGRKLLEDHIQQIEQGCYDVLVFFLASQADGATLLDIAKLGKDLDRLSGSRCLVIAFMPPGNAPSGKLYELFDQAPTPKDSAGKDWDAFVSAMTDNTYDLAEYFEIPFAELPCMLFVDTALGTYAVLPLSGKPLTDIYPKLRRIFGEWYARLAVVGDRDHLLELAHSRPSACTRSTSPPLRQGMREVLLREVFPIIEKSVIESVQGQPEEVRSRAHRVLNATRAGPTSMRALERFLSDHNLSVTLGGRLVHADELSRANDELFSERMGLIVQASVGRAEMQRPRFPIREVTRLGAEIRVREEVRSAGSRLSKAITWLSDIKKLLSPLHS